MAEKFEQDINLEKKKLKPVITYIRRHQILSWSILDIFSLGMGSQIRMCE